MIKCTDKFIPGDAVKVYDNDALCGCLAVRYGDVVRVNKKTVTVKLESGSNIRVKPENLNYD